MIKFGAKTLELIGDRKKYDGKKGKRHILFWMMIMGLKFIVPMIFP